MATPGTPEPTLKRADSHPIELDDVDTYLDTRETEIEDLKTQLDNATKAKDAAEAELAAATARFDADQATSQRDIAALQVKVTAAEQKVREHEAQIQALREERESLIGAKDEANEKLEKANALVVNLEAVQTKLTGEITAAKETFEIERARLERERATLVALNDERNGEIAENEAEIAALTDQRTQLVKEHVAALSGLKASLEATVARLRSVEAERDAAKAEVERITGELAEVRTQFEAANRELAEAQQFRAVAQSALEQHVADFNAAKAQIEAIRAEVEGHREMISGYMRQIAELLEIANAGLTEQSGVYGALKGTIGAMKEHVDAEAEATAAAEVRHMAEIVQATNRIGEIQQALKAAEEKAAISAKDAEKQTAAIAALNVQLAAAETERARLSARGVPDAEPMPTADAAPALRDYISRRYQRSAEDARNIITAARKLREGTAADAALETLEDIEEKDKTEPLPVNTGGAYRSRGGGALAATMAPIGEFLSRRRVPVAVKTAFLGTGFMLLVASYAVVMALVSREWVVSLVSAAMAFIVLYVVAWTLVFLRWGGALASGMTVGLLIGHFAVLYFVLMFSVRGDSGGAMGATGAEDKKKRMELLTVRIYSVWLLASLAVAFV